MTVNVMRLERQLPAEGNTQNGENVLPVANLMVDSESGTPISYSRLIVTGVRVVRLYVRLCHTHISQNSNRSSLGYTRVTHRRTYRRTTRTDTIGVLFSDAPANPINTFSVNMSRKSDVKSIMQHDSNVTTVDRHHHATERSNDDITTTCSDLRH